MGKESIHGRTEDDMKETINLTKSMDTEFMFGQMAGVIALFIVLEYEG
jgi:flagellar biogenesis protein FliO